MSLAVFGVATHEAYHWASVAATGKTMSDDEDEELQETTRRCICDKHLG